MNLVASLRLNSLWNVRNTVNNIYHNYHIKTPQFHISVTPRLKCGRSSSEIIINISPLRRPDFIYG